MKGRYLTRIKKTVAIFHRTRHGVKRRKNLLFKAHIPLETGFALGNQHAIYMATYIPSARVVGNAKFRVGIGGNSNFSIFRYQHVGIPNAKLWRWGSKLTRGPNANGFASQWNICLSLYD